MSETLKALLRYVKSPGGDFSWRAIRDQVRAPLYHADMSLPAVVQVLMAAYEQALLEPRFKIPGRDTAALDLVLATIKGCHSIELLGWTNVDANYSIEQFYNAMIGKLLGDLQASRADWCRDELWPTGKQPATAVPILG